MTAALSGAAPTAAQGWDDYLAPDAVRGERLFHHAMNHVLCALGANECVPDVDSAMLGPEVHWEHALVRLERALRYLPGDPDVLFWRALALSQWERDDGGEVERRVSEAIAAFEELRRTHPEVSPGRVAFELAILRTRQRDWAGASAEYAIAAAAESLPPAVPQLFPDSTVIGPFRPAFYSVGEAYVSIPIERAYGNWAEVTMLAGDADGAIDLYESAVEVAGSAWPDAALALFGLGLALDRAGAHDAALEAVRRAMDVEVPPELPDGTSSAPLVRRHTLFAALHSEGVFFEPECEIRAYHALGEEAIAGESSSAEGRRANLGEALREWRAFLSEGGREGPWAARAEENVTRLEALLADD